MRRMRKKGQRKIREEPQGRVEAEKGGSRINGNLTHAKIGMERVHPVLDRSKLGSNKGLHPLLASIALTPIYRCPCRQICPWPHEGRPMGIHRHRHRHRPRVLFESRSRRGAVRDRESERERDKRVCVCVWVCVCVCVCLL
jgi:hypothetical protein